MSRLRLRLHQLRTVPPHTAAQKLVRRAISPLWEYHKQRCILVRQPYTTSRDLPWSQPLHIARRLHASGFALSNEELDILRSIVEHCCNGRWYILGSGWLEPTHSENTMEDVLQQSSVSSLTPTQANPHEWLRTCVPPPAFPRSQWLWKLIQSSHEPLDWQRDFCSGYRWNPTQWHSTLRRIQVYNADPKVLWEFGRLQLLPLLALAGSRFPEHQISLAQTIETVLLDFAAQNPPGFGIQWASTMDVAIRLANILVTLDLARELPLRQNVGHALTLYCYDHAQFVLDNLEWSEGMRGNHYLACIAGLAVAAAYFPECEWTRSLQQWCSEQLRQELYYQFLDDGGNFEASLAYHRLSVEMLCWALWMLLQTNEGKRLLSDSKLQPYLKRIACFTVDTTYTSSIAPQIGDNDSGRFLALLPWAEEWIPPHVWHGQADPYLAQRSHKEAIVLCGSLVQTCPTPTPLSSKHIIRSSSFIAPAFGVGVLRAGEWEVFLRAGDIGQRGKGGHAHNDQLSITIAYAGEELIVDCGTFVYTSQPVWRNYFRSTERHNTLQLKQHEQNEWLESGSSETLFWMMTNRARARLLTCTESLLVAEHYAYGTPHRRVIRADVHSVSITDYFPHYQDAVIRFHLHPRVFVHHANAELASLEIGRTKCTIKLTNGRLRLENAYYSHSYGVMCPCVCLVIEPQSQAICTTFYREDSA